MKHFSDPKITVEEALSFAGSQAKLAGLLDISRSSVNDWISSNRDYLPSLQAYRFREIKASQKTLTD